MRAKKIRELIKLLEDSDIDEITVTGYYFPFMPYSVTVRKTGVVYQSKTRQANNPTIDNKVKEQAEPAVEKPAELNPDEYHIIKSPMVGTFYTKPGPEEKPFVEVGSKIKKGDTVCIVEAMKLMNEIEADESGTIVKVFQEDAQPVEYGQDLFYVQT